MPVSPEEGSSQYFPGGKGQVGDCDIIPVADLDDPGILQAAAV